MAQALPWIGAATGLYGTLQLTKASKRAAATQKKLSKPLLKMQRFALPQLRDLVLGEFMPRIAEEDPFLRGTHEENLAQIGRAERGNLAQSEHFWTGAGNLGRGRGERFRIRQAATEARGREGLGYTGQRRAGREEAARRAAEVLVQSAGLGGQGLQPALSAAKTRAAATGDVWSNIAGILGGGVGDWEARKERKELLDAIKRNGSSNDALRILSYLW